MTFSSGAELSHCQPTYFKENQYIVPFGVQLPAAQDAVGPKAHSSPLRDSSSAHKHHLLLLHSVCLVTQVFLLEGNSQGSWQGGLGAAQLLSALYTRRMESWEDTSLPAAAPSTCFPAQAQKSGLITSTRTQFSCLALVGFNFKLSCLL